MPQFLMQFMKWEKIKGKSRKWMENGREMPSILGEKGEREKTPYETRVFSGPGSQPRCWAHREGGRCRLSGRVLDSLGDSEPLSTLACSEMLLTLCRKKKIYISKSQSTPFLLPASIGLTCWVSHLHLQAPLRRVHGAPHGERRVLGRDGGNGGHLVQPRRWGEAGIPPVCRP